jgi:hypothetical protein
MEGALGGEAVNKAGSSHKGRRPVEGKPPTITIPRGLTRELVERIFRQNARAEMSTGVAQYAILTASGKSLASTSVRRAIEHLEGMGKLVRIPGTATWKWAGKE